MIKSLESTKLFIFSAKVRCIENFEFRLKGTVIIMNKFDKSFTDCAASLMSFIEKSPTAFHAVENISKRLDEIGYTRLEESGKFDIVRGGKYYVTRNRSSIIAFEIPKEKGDTTDSFMICASHSDSPMFKIKSNGEITALGNYTKLNTEKYGGMIMSSWFDRPLSIAGRVIIKKDGRFESKTVNIDRDVAIIPNVCIHFNRTINDGYRYNAQTDLLPIIGDAAETGALEKEIADCANVSAEDIVASDLYLYNRTKAAFIGLSGEFFSAPRIDNLGCAFGSFEGFISSEPTKGVIPVYAVFDNEETGSQSKQGAASTFLYDTLRRICSALNISGDEYQRMIAKSFMVSADNGHAKHPNHPELSDCDNSPFMNKGVVIKYNANQRYTTDALSAAIFGEICKKADVPVQVFANRSDLAGGSTLGNISQTQVSLNTVDIGLAQLAMHSAYETAGTADILYLKKAIKAFYETAIYCEGDGIYRI